MFDALTTPTSRPSAAGSKRGLPSRLLALLESGSPAHPCALLDPDEQSLDDLVWDDALLDLLRDFLGRPAKGFRAKLVKASFRAVDPRADIPEALPLLVELLHAGSLIVDDIEDASATRRGEPALHVRHGLGPALNAGNWLYLWPLALIDQLPIPVDRKPRLQRLMHRTLLRCHQGQALDLTVDVHTLARAQVPEVVRVTTQLKTASLFELAAALGVVAAGGDRRLVEHLVRFGRALGSGLQMLDDYGSIRSARRRHKGVEDVRLARATWAWAWLASECADADFAALRSAGERVRDGKLEADTLVERMAFSLSDRPHDIVHQQCAEALERLRRDPRTAPLADEAESEIARLEASYE